MFLPLYAALGDFFVVAKVISLMRYCNSTFGAIAYLSRASLLLLFSITAPTEPLPSRTDWTIATGRTGGSEEHTSQEGEEGDEFTSTASPLATTMPPLPTPLTPGLTGSCLISIIHFSLCVEAERLTTNPSCAPVVPVEGPPGPPGPPGPLLDGPTCCQRAASAATCCCL